MGERPAPEREAFQAEALRLTGLRNQETNSLPLMPQVMRQWETQHCSPDEATGKTHGGFKLENLEALRVEIGFIYGREPTKETM